MRKPELLVPANNLQVLREGVLYGADAIYIGGPAFSLRAMASNFSLEEMKEGIGFAHERNVKVYVTVNVFAHNGDFASLRKYFAELNEIHPDGVLISDPGVFTTARTYAPDLEIHISTQANNTNYETYKFWYDLGVRRVVAARELSLEEIREIRDQIPEDMEIETFVHGAMCMSYSGRCLLSNYLTGRDANRGACTHPCRWNYAVVEEKRPGEYMPVEEDERGTYIFNSKDLCMIEHLPKMIEAGIDSLKIEGRMKNALYVASVTRTYRKALDDYFESPELFYQNLEWYKEEIGKCTHRSFSTGFFFGNPYEEGQIYNESVYEKDYIYLGFSEGLDERGYTVMTQKNKFSVGDLIEIMEKGGKNTEVEVLEILDARGKSQESCPHACQEIHVKFSKTPELYDILRVRAK